MRQFSAKRAAVQRRRRAVLQRSHGPERCQWPRGCASEAVDAHEALSRARGGDPTDPDWLLCRRHHDDVTTATGAFLAWCIEQGLIRSVSPRDTKCHNETLANTSASDAHAHTLCTVPAKQAITLRVTDSASKWIEDRAKKHGVSRAVVTRAMLSVATHHEAEVATKIAALKEVQ